MLRRGIFNYSWDIFFSERSMKTKKKEIFSFVGFKVHINKTSPLTLLFVQLEVSFVSGSWFFSSGGWSLLHWLWERVPNYCWVLSPITGNIDECNILDWIYCILMKIWGRFVLFSGDIVILWKTLKLSEHSISI